MIKSVFYHIFCDMIKNMNYDKKTYGLDPRECKVAGHRKNLKKKEREKKNK